MKPQSLAGPLPRPPPGFSNHKPLLHELRAGIWGGGKECDKGVPLSQEKGAKQIQRNSHKGSLLLHLFCQ